MKILLLPEFSKELALKKHILQYTSALYKGDKVGTPNNKLYINAIIQFKGDIVKLQVTLGTEYNCTITYSKGVKRITLGNNEGTDSLGIYHFSLIAYFINKDRIKSLVESYAESIFNQLQYNEIKSKPQIDIPLNLVFLHSKYPEIFEIT